MMMMIRMQTVVNKQVHQVVIKNHPVVVKNEIRKLIKFGFFIIRLNALISVALVLALHRQTIIEMVLTVIVHRTIKNRNYLQFLFLLYSNYVFSDRYDKPSSSSSHRRSNSPRSSKRSDERRRSR